MRSVANTMDMSNKFTTKKFVCKLLLTGARTCNNNYDLRLFDSRHTAQSITTNINHAERDTQQPPRRAALYTEGLSGKRLATNGAQQLINRT